jgi:hypothetical protein
MCLSTYLVLKPLVPLRVDQELDTNHPTAVADTYGSVHGRMKALEALCVLPYLAR